MDGRRLDHWRTVVWDPGIVDSWALSVCYDCLCLMYGLGLMLGIAGQLPGKNVIYHAYIHPVLWIGCVAIV